MSRPEMEFSKARLEMLCDGIFAIAMTLLVLERQNTVRQEVAMALAAVLTQTLMPKIGGGRIPAAELLMVGYGARQQVRKNAPQHLHQEITITRKQGSFTLEESLAELVKQGLVDRKDALTRAGHVEELERLLG